MHTVVIEARPSTVESAQMRAYVNFVVAAAPPLAAAQSAALAVAFRMPPRR